MAPSTTTVKKLGAVLPVEAASFLDAHVFPGVPGVYVPGVPVAIDGDAAAFEALVAEHGAPLEIGEFEFDAPEDEESAEMAALKKLKLPALLAHAEAAGVGAAVVAGLSKPGTSKQQVIDAIAAVGENQEG